MGLVSGGGLARRRWRPTSRVTDGDGQKYFSAALTVSIALIVLAYLLIFPAFVALRLRAARPRAAVPRPRRHASAPGWSSCLATGWSLLAARLPAVARASGRPIRTPRCRRASKATALEFELIVLSPVVVLLVLCGVFFALGARTRRVARSQVEMSV